MGLPAIRLLSYDEYLALEQETDIRHEFLDGYAVAMAGGTPAHSELCVRTSSTLFALLRRGPCRVYQSDLKIHIPETRLYTYADAVVVCGGLERTAHDRNVVTNPAVLCEVLSPTTEEYDRGEKFEHYQKLTTLRDYLLVSTDRVQIEHYSRIDDQDVWTFRRVGPGGTVMLSVQGVEIPVDEIYEGVELEARRERLRSGG